MIIVKRKIGNEEFYYIQYTYRKNKKPVTISKYLGKKLPSQQEIENLKKKLLFEQKQELYKKLESVKEKFQKNWQKIPESVKEQQLHEIAIAFTYNTNAIEGSTITLEDTREIIEQRIAPKKPMRDIKETENHAKVFLQMLKKPEQITVSLILHWHKELFEETKLEIAGVFRDYLVRVGDYRAPDWQDVEKLMNEFIKKIEKEYENPVEHAARIHYHFEKIHPFGDGNGRVGRLLMNHILWHARYPMLIIEYKKRASYYKALKDEERFVKYFIRRYLAVHQSSL
ncbi:MAG: Fic family protein [Candidatus Woesearchaeota archaeon]|jgi:Fic family protein